MPSSAFQTCALRSEEHTSELQSLTNLVCRLLLEKTSVTVLVVAVALKSLTLTVTVSTLTALSSVMKMPAVSVPVLSAVTVPTLVLRWLPAAPIASSAARRRFVAVTFLLLPVALMMAPVSARMLTLAAVTLPSVTLLAALSLALLAVAVTLASPAIVKAPPSASRLIVPAVPVLMSTRVAVPLPSSTSVAAFSVMWPVPLMMSLLTTRLPVFTSISTEPAPLALTAVPSMPAPVVLAVPLFRVNVPPATKTMLPLVPATRSLCAASVTVLVVAVALKSLTLTVTVSTLTALSSVMKMPAVSVPVLSAVTVPTLVLRWLPAAPIASSAARRRFVAVTFLLLPVALMMAPVSARMLTLAAVTLPSVTLLAALSLALLAVAVTLASPAIVKAPPSASRLIVPAVPVLMSTRVAVPLPSSTSVAAFSVMWPVPLMMSLLTTRLPVFTSISTEPAPLALTAVPSMPAPVVLAVPLFRVTVPPATKTMLPLVPATRSLCAASVTVLVVAVALKSLTLTVTVSTLTALSSVMKMPAVSVPVLSAVTVPTLVLRWLPAAPIASSAARRRFVAVTFLLLPVALMMAPVSARMLTLAAVTLPSVTLLAALSLALLAVAVTLASPAIVKAPPSASRLIVPAVPVLMSTRVAVPLPSSTSVAAFSVMWPVPLMMSLLTTRLPVFTSISTEPAPLALTAVPSMPAPVVLAVPLFRVTVPPATKTMLPLVPATRSLCVASVTVLVVAVALKSLTLTVTVSTLTALSSVMKMPAVSVPVLSAVTVPTLVLRWLPAAPIASSAARRRFVAVTFLLLPVALMMAPVSARMLTLAAVTLPSVTLLAALSLALLLVAVTLASPAIVKAPPSASRLIVPAVPVLMSTRVAVPLPSSTSVAALSVMWPVPLTMSLLTTRLPVFTSISTEPAALAVAAVPSMPAPVVLAVPLFRVTVPPATKTMLPLVPATRSLCVASVTVLVVAVALKS